MSKTMEVLFPEIKIWKNYFDWIIFFFFSALLYCSFRWVKLMTEKYNLLTLNAYDDTLPKFKLPDCIRLAYIFKYC